MPPLPIPAGVYQLVLSTGGFIRTIHSFQRHEVLAKTSTRADLHSSRNSEQLVKLRISVGDSRASFPNKLELCDAEGVFLRSTPFSQGKASKRMPATVVRKFRLAPAEYVWKVHWPHRHSRASLSQRQGDSRQIEVDDQS